MSISRGAKLGSYEILSLLGAGGMGGVYRARDTKLGRDVAIKVLPDAFLSDAERLARFEREARVLASLNHPHIGAIYGLEEADGVRALVLELVEGPTLAERLKAGPVPVTEALTIARQIADALEAAHEKGIGHRDLKPANIKITPDGMVKMLDFGLAKVFAGDASGPDLSQVPTVAAGGTREGVILGTAAYMSPEQARGKLLDKRTDIWSFGCGLYEMLTGRVAFAAATLSDTIVAILEREPDWNALPATTPPNIRRLLRRCVEKDPKRRLHDIADARIEIDEALAVPATTLPGDAPLGITRATWLSVALIAPVLLALAAFAGWTLRPVFSPDARAPVGAGPAEMRLQITTPPTTDPISLAISPQGQKVVFGASWEGRSLLWLRALDSVSARPLPGTEDASFPFWSPDSRAVGFFANRQLKRIDLDVGTVRALATASGGRGGAWNREGAIIFQPTSGDSPLSRISAAGGESTPVAGPKALWRPRFPHFLPDGRHFLYYAGYAGSTAGVRGVYVGQLDGPDTRRLLDAEGAAVYARSGHLLLVRERTMFAQGFDAVRLSRSRAPAGEREL